MATVNGKNHRWLVAGLLAMGYRWEVATNIATRKLMGQTLFPKEAEDADTVLAALTSIKQKQK